MALLGSFGSRHTLRVPLILHVYVSELTHGVDSTCGVMISCAALSISWLVVSSLALIGTLHLQCCIGRTLGLSVIEHSPDILHVLLKESGEHVLCVFSAVDTYLFLLWEAVDYSLEKGIQLYCGLQKGEWLLVWMCFMVHKCVFWTPLGVYVGLSCCGTILSNPSWMLVVCDIMTSYLVSTLKIFIGISLPVI